MLWHTYTVSLFKYLRRQPYRHELKRRVVALWHVHALVRRVGGVYIVAEERRAPLPPTDDLGSLSLCRRVLSVWYGIIVHGQKKGLHDERYLRSFHLYTFHVTWYEERCARCDGYVSHFDDPEGLVVVLRL